MEAEAHESHEAAEAAADTFADEAGCFFVWKKNMWRLSIYCLEWEFKRHF